MNEQGNNQQNKSTKLNISISVIMQVIKNALVVVRIFFTFSWQ
jgi:hypothetical protein